VVNSERLGCAVKRTAICDRLHVLKIVPEHFDFPEYICVRGGS
jgi:hypothetical protein